MLPILKVRCVPRQELGTGSPRPFPTDEEKKKGGGVKSRVAEGLPVTDSGEVEWFSAPDHVWKLS